MAQIIERLSALKVEKVKAPGMYLDGAGLYLQVSGNGTDRVNKSWLFQYKFNGRQRQMGLGSYTVLCLAEARAKAAEARKLRLSGIDPLEARNADKAAEQLERAKETTFEECAEAYIKAHRPGWKNEKHAAQWQSSLKTYAYPLIGKLPVQEIDTDKVLSALQPIWTKVTETATRIRSRIELILDWAKVKGLRTGDNPARWKGHLDKLLPRRSKVQKVKHHPALPYNDMAAFMVKLRKEEGVAARALEFVIMTCTRTTEARKAEWPEIGDKDTIWTVPEGRMKGEREHRIPLSSPATSVLRLRRKEQRKGEKLIFPSTKPGKSLSENAMLALLGRMGYGHITVHGFRSTFRDWAADCTEYADAVAEVALSHVNDDETEAAYKRSDLFEKRRALMGDWAKFCETQTQTNGAAKADKKAA